MSTSVAATPATRAARPAANPWLGAVYAGIFTAVFTAIMIWLFQANTWAWLIPFLLIGVGPVLGYQMARGRLFGDWKSILGGIIGSIPVLGLILWPILTGALTRGQSIGRLFLWHLIGLVLGVAVFLILGTLMGQDPIWFYPGLTIGFAVWGGTVGAAMASTPDLV